MLIYNFLEKIKKNIFISYLFNKFVKLNHNYK